MLAVGSIFPGSTLLDGGKGHIEGEQGKPGTLFIRSENLHPPKTNVAQVIMGGYDYGNYSTYSTLFLRDDGTVWATGENDHGHLGGGIIPIETTQPRSSYQMGLLLLMYPKLS